ncbi:unnamed protein product [Chrysodeixis includens]|uniref:Venom serine protease 34 n=1 Tax=Chrysodeixis includens TaxID=689277 RepID=A0A9P0BUX5_CHRIL|nr:unnamed protein product [Chrysodeixis includens]
MYLNLEMSIGVFLILWLVTYSAAQDANCDFAQNVTPGQTYYITSPGYPQNYRGGVECRWIAICPSGYNCRMDCPEISIPQTDRCTMDRLLVSRTGDPQLISAEPYCGRGTLSVVSTAQRLSIGLLTSTSSPGGRFYCELKAQLANTNPNPGTCSCGVRRTNRIVGGEETGINEFPMMAGVIHVEIKSIKCGGTIVTDQFVLTAAHCVAGRSTGNTAVVVGEHNVQYADSPATVVHQLERIIIHPQYVSSSYDYDIAMLKVVGTIAFNDRVGPSCLPFKFQNTNFAGSTVTVLGWGTIFPGGPVSKYLQKVDLEVISQERCRAAVSTGLTNRQMCTLTPGKDACQDDSGGPLLYTDPATGLLFNVGIVAAGTFCASRDNPGIHNRVTSYLSWIVSVAPYNYCRK